MALGAAKAGGSLWHVTEKCCVRLCSVAATVAVVARAPAAARAERPAERAARDQPAARLARRRAPTPGQGAEPIVEEYANNTRARN